MSEFQACPYSKSQVVNAGKALAGRIVDNAEDRDQAIQNFSIAHSWRAACAYPMRRTRAELIGKIRSHPDIQGISAARLKRMISMRKKLKATPFTLYQMQDIAGCRAIVNDAEQLDRLVDIYLGGGSRYAIVRDDDYIATPRHTTGYRSRHLVLKFCDIDGVEGFDRHFVELQLRTFKQHAWSTAVEAIGLIRNEDLKGGTGDKNWLRLFQIMASEFAEDEKRPLVEGVSSNTNERREELSEINREIGALQVLESCNRAIKITENYARTSAPYYLIEYNISEKSVKVSPFTAAISGSKKYNSSEIDVNTNSVFVEVDRVSDLRAAYPNYFLDVGAFAKRLRQALKGHPGSTFSNWLSEWARSFTFDRS